MTLHFVILGKPQVKKNSKQIIYARGHPMIISSKAYRRWEQDAVMQVKAQWDGEPLDRELNAAIVSYLGARQRPDASNLYEGPQDVLQKAGVIRNDSLIVSHDGSRRYRDRDNPRVEITLTPAEET